jgi:cephalosporin-C deacetylase-like acetyl esterase
MLLANTRRFAATFGFGFLATVLAACSDQAPNNNSQDPGSDTQLLFDTGGLGDTGSDSSAGDSAPDVAGPGGADSAVGTDTGEAPDTSNPADLVADTDNGGAPDSIAINDSVATNDSVAINDSVATPDSGDPPDAAAGQTDVAEGSDSAASTDSGLVWDLQAVGDLATAKCTYSQESTGFEGLTQVKSWQVTYQSWEWLDGQLKPILIRGFAARPVNGSKFPGIVQAHGLGGSSKLNDAVSLAGRLGVFAVAYTGPGGGAAEQANLSEGLPAGHNNGYRMFDVLSDVRGSWFWGHATAAMRAVTCLTGRPEVDTTKLGVTGFSAGGVVSLLVAGHDPRVKAAVPLSGTLAWDTATLAPKAWQHTLLQKAGLSVASAEWQKLMSDLIAPGVALAQAKAAVLMVNGTTDEFFPMTAHMATWNAIPTDKRLAFAGNFDHGCYGISGGEPAATIEARAKIRAEGGQMAWFGHWFGTDADFGYLPVTPQFTIQSVGGASLVSAVVDGGGNKLQIDEVRVWWSNDDAFFFASDKLDKQSGTVYGKLVPVALQPNSVVFVDVTYKTSLPFVRKFALATVPQIGASLVPNIRGIDSCL